MVVSQNQIAGALTPGHAAPVLFFLMAKVVPEARIRPEQGVLDRLARGDASALRSLFDTHGGQALAVALRVLRNASEAEEVVQETFVEVWKRAAQYDGTRGGAQAWILTIARTRAIDRLRSRDSAQRAAHAAAIEPAPPRAAVPLELVEQRQDRERVALAMETLPAEQRAAVELAYFEGLTHREISEKTQTPLGTVKTRMRLALEKLADKLGDGSGGRP
jgi:RNA polymerase sigma-70 factor (ECF subfamily)